MRKKLEEQRISQAARSEEKLIVSKGNGEMVEGKSMAREKGNKLGKPGGKYLKCDEVGVKGTDECVESSEDEVLECEGGQVSEMG